MNNPGAMVRRFPEQGRVFEDAMRGIYMICESHPNHMVTQYCQDCNMSVCSMCSFEKHRVHQIIKLAEWGVEKINRPRVFPVPQIHQDIHVEKVSGNNETDTAEVNNTKAKIEQQMINIASRLKAIEIAEDKKSHFPLPDKHKPRVCWSDALSVRKIPLMGEGFGVTGIAVMKETLWVVHGAQPYLYAYPLAAPNEPQKIHMENLKDPDNITVCHSERSELMISDRGSNSLVTVEVRQIHNIWEAARSRMVKLRFTPWGLGFDKEDMLVCDGEEIHIFSLSCEPTGRIQTPQNIRPWKALPRPISPGFVVRDRYNKQICVLNKNGDMIHTYKGQNEIRPGDIACHGEKIYVIDQKNTTVDELNKDGIYVREVIGENQGLSKPS